MSGKELIKFALARTAVGRLLGGVRPVRAAYSRYALTRRYSRIFSGVYASRQEALAHVPVGQKVGWDHEAASSIWLGDIDHVWPYTYPVLFWLSQLLRPAVTLADHGGSIGVTYYAYGRYAKLPPDTRWIVVEVPAIVAQGRATAAQQDAAGLTFTTDLSECAGCNILLSSGALQYTKESPCSVLDMIGSRPDYILFNLLPLTKGKTFWTLQNFGAGLSPYRIFNEADFIGDLNHMGYVVRDRWTNPDVTCDIPLHPDRSVRALTGLCLVRQHC